MDINNLDRAIDLRGRLNNMRHIVSAINNNMSIGLQITKEGDVLVSSRDLEILDTVKKKAESIINEINKEIETL